MTVSKPLSIVLQLIVLGMVISAGVSFQAGETGGGITTGIMALIVFLLSTRRKKTV